MNIILLERIEKLGQIGDLVTVKSGYARNFLLPQGKAVFASKDNIKIFENKKSQLEAENITRKKEAESLSSSISFKEIIVIRAASESGQLYGSVSSKDIAKEVTNLGLTINKSQVVLNKTLKTLAYEDVTIILHPEVFVKFKLNIARSVEEAKEQSKSGKAIITTEITGGDIRSDRAQKDAKRFEKKSNADNIDKKVDKDEKRFEKKSSADDIDKKIDKDAKGFEKKSNSDNVDKKVEDGLKKSDERKSKTIKKELVEEKKS